MECHICHSDVVKQVMKVSKRDIYECGDCQTQFIYPMHEYYGEYVANNLCNPYYGWLTFNRQSKIINGLEGAGCILDYGCGGGHFLSHMGKWWLKFGIDVSDEARRVASTKGIQVFKSIKDMNFNEGFFNVITMFAVIEHLITPRETIQELSKFLIPNGLLVVMTGDVTSKKAVKLGSKWHMYKSPEHFHFFSAKGLDMLMEGCGFKKIKSLYTDGGMTKTPFLDRFYPVLKGLPLFDHYYAYYKKSMPLGNVR